jgi:hypothetical protein
MRSGPVFSASLLLAALAMAFASPARADIVVNIDKSTQRMTVSVDGAPRYEWPVSTGRAGYDTPNGTFKVNRMDADHLSQEWDNAPMPHSMFFDMHGHAIHGFFDVKHLGLPVSHGCVRISPDHAATLYQLVAAEGMKEAIVVISGQTPPPMVAQRNLNAVQPRAPVADNAAQPMDIAPRYDQPPLLPQQPPPYDQQSYYRQPPPGYGQPLQPYYGQAQQPYYGQPVYVVPQQQYYVLQPYNRY